MEGYIEEQIKNGDGQRCYGC